METGSELQRVKFDSAFGSIFFSILRTKVQRIQFQCRNCRFILIFFVTFKLSIEKKNVQVKNFSRSFSLVLLLHLIIELTTINKSRRESEDGKGAKGVEFTHKRIKSNSWFARSLLDTINNENHQHRRSRIHDTFHSHTSVFISFIFPFKNSISSSIRFNGFCWLQSWQKIFFFFQSSLVR